MSGSFLPSLGRQPKSTRVEGADMVMQSIHCCGGPKRTADGLRVMPAKAVQPITLIDLGFLEEKLLGFLDLLKRSKKTVDIALRNGLILIAQNGQDVVARAP